MLTRRAFVTAVSAAAALTSLRARADEGPKLRMALKYGMIGLKDASILEHFKLAKAVGFEGVEMDSPSKLNRDEVLAASKETGLVVHGVVDSIHWGVRLSDPKPEIREKGLEGLKTALNDCKFYGGDTVLLVPGKVAKNEADNENYDQVWSRSQEEIKKVIPLADQLGLKIAIEVVWNNFITKPEQLVEYVDSFKTPTIGAYFDCSNMIKFGVPPAEWIRKLGKRMLKFDFKAYSNTKQWAVKIGEGDEDWPEILKALKEVGYNGWATSEVGAGGEEHLKDVLARMQKVLTMPK